jgi:hypothetical protein
MASTNQCRVSAVNGVVHTPGIPSAGRRNDSPFSPPVISVQVKMMT